MIGKSADRPTFVDVRYRPCPVCGAKPEGQRQVIHYSHPVLKRHFPILECVSCATWYADLEASAALACNEQYLAEGHLQRYLQLANKAQYYAYRSAIQALGPPSAGQKLLDYGAGIGSLMLIALEQGWDAYGVDPSPYANWARDKLGLKIFVGHLDQSPYPDGFFDAIISLSTLEHIYDLRHEVKVIFDKLRPGGVLAVGGVPNLESVEATAIRRFSKNWQLLFDHNDPPSHINFLTPRTIRIVMEQAGFSTVKVQTYGIKAVSDGAVRDSLKVGVAGPNAPAAIRKNPDAIGHPFLAVSSFKAKRSLRDFVLAWGIQAYMKFRVPFGGDKLFVLARK